MTYKEAKKIQSIIFDLNVMDDETTYSCAVEPMGTEGQYYCYLYSDSDSGLEFLALHTFALGLHEMLRNLCWMPDRTFIQIDKEFRQSIRMW